MQSRPGDSFLGMGMTIPEDATRIIKMTEAVTIDELGNDEEYADIVEDMRDESNKVCLAFPWHADLGWDKAWPALRLHIALLAVERMLGGHASPAASGRQGRSQYHCMLVVSLLRTWPTCS